jgi:HTH-type transcriptional regulator/antitoxin HigA
MATHAEPIRITRRGNVSVMDLVIENKTGHARALATVKGLMCRQRTPEENALLKVLSDAIERFESKAFPSFGNESSPADVVHFLLETNGQSAKDLWGVIGQKSHVSEILSGKRRISNQHAVRLGKHFNVSPITFLKFE